MRARSVQRVMADTEGLRIEGLLHVGRNHRHQAEFRVSGLPLVLRLDRQQLIEMKRGIAEAERRMGEIDNGAEVLFPRTERLVF